MLMLAAVKSACTSLLTCLFNLKIKFKTLISIRKGLPELKLKLKFADSEICTFFSVKIPQKAKIYKLF